MSVLNELFIASSIFVLVLTSCLALYLPLLAFTKNNKLTGQYIIPLSISIEIIFGYVFYCLNVVKFFPVTYLILVLMLNLISIFFLKPKFNNLKPKLKPFFLISFLIASAALLFSRYFDPFTHIGPGANDTYYHIGFIKNLITQGFLSNGYYAPGFHLFMMPIAKIIDYSSLYRFAGPALGLIFALNLFLIFKEKLKNKFSLILLLSLLSFPLYNQLTLQTTGFFSSALTFIFFPALIVLASDQENGKIKTKLGMISIIFLGLALSVPYLFVELIAAFVMTIGLALILKRKLVINIRYQLLIGAILMLGFLASLGHVVIQSKLLKRYEGFPNVRIANVQDAEGAGNETQSLVDSGDLVSKTRLPSIISQNSFLRPMIGAGMDLVKVKNIREAKSLLGLGGYIWMALCVFLLFYSAKRKNLLLFTIAVFSLVFGLSTQTGMFEMTFYRGRSGWYLLMLSMLGTVLFIDDVASKKWYKTILIGSILLGICGFIAPPVYYRPYYDQKFAEVKKIADNNKNKSIKVISRERSISIVASNLQPLQPEAPSLVEPNTIVIIETKIFAPNPLLSQSVVSTDKNLEQFNKWLLERNQKINQQNEELLSSNEFSKYKKILETETFTIYSNL